MGDPSELNTKSMMKTKLNLLTVLAASLFLGGCASLDDGLIAHYPFSGDAKNLTGNGHDGEVKGAELSADRHDTEKSSYNFDGEDDYILIKEPLLPYDKIPYTISLWVNAAKDAGGVVMSDRYGSSCNYNYWVAIGGWTIFQERVHQKAIGAKNFSREKWEHMVCVYDLSSGQMYFYLNGEKTEERKHENAWSDAKNPTTIGVLFGCKKYGAKPSGWYKSSVDEVRFYNRALSAAEVKALYDLEKPKK